MKSAIRAVVRTGLHLGHEVVGIHEGFKGLLSSNFRLLTARDVGGIVQQGGTMLGSGRCAEFKLDTGVQKAPTILEAANIYGLVVIGWKGFQTGAAPFAATGFLVGGMPSTS